MYIFKVLFNYLSAIYFQVGTPNPEVSLSVIDLSNPSSKAIVLEAPVDVVGRQVYNNFNINNKRFSRTHIFK